MIWITPQRNQGQAVEVSYLPTSHGVLRRSLDRSEGAKVKPKYSLARYLREEKRAGWEPDSDWRPENDRLYRVVSTREATNMIESAE